MLVSDVFHVCQVLNKLFFVHKSYQRLETQFVTIHNLEKSKMQIRATQPAFTSSKLAIETYETYFTPFSSFSIVTLNM